MRERMCVRALQDVHVSCEQTLVRGYTVCCWSVRLTVMGWPTDMMESSRTTLILAVEAPLGVRGPVMATRSRVSSRGAKTTKM